MEILVRRSDLARELHLVQGIVERKNSIPILSNVLAEARSGELRISATDLDVSLHLRLPGRGRDRGRRHALGEEALRDRPLAARQPTSASLSRRTPGRGSAASGPSSGWRACRARTSRPCPRRAPRRPVEIPAAILKTLILAHRLRDHRRGRALLPRRRAARAREGSRCHGGDRRPPPGVGPARGTMKVSEPVRILVPRKAITELGAPDGGARARRDGLLPAGRGAPRLHGRRPDARVEDGRGAVPRVREGDRGHRRQEDRAVGARGSSPPSSA